MMFIRRVAFAVFIGLMSMSVSVSVHAVDTYTPSSGEFDSAIVMRTDGKIIYQYHGDQPHTAASLTKLLMGLVMADKNWNWGTIVKMSPGDEVGGGRLRVAPGAPIVLADLWQSALGSSANNATMAIARFAGPGIKPFIEKMNTKAKDLGASSSVFFDPSGMNAKNTTTAKDMALIARAAFREDRIVRAAQSGTYTFMLANSTKSHTIKNTNAPLLNDPDIYLVGGKTGYLPESMYNYAAQLAPMDHESQKKVTGKDVVIVVLGARSTESAMASTKRLAEWAWTDESRFRTSQYPAPQKTLVFGNSGDDVRWVQEQLQVKPINGNFGPATRAAVQAFQEEQGIAKKGKTGYGVVGPATRAKLLELAP